MSCVKTRRLFLALLPDDHVRHTLRVQTGQWAVPAGANPVAPADWHITLEFLGTVPEAARDSIEAVLTDMVFRTAPLVLDSFEYWSEANVGVLCATRPPDGLQRVHASLRERLRVLGLRVDTRPWRPHLTLLRGLRGPLEVRSVTPVHWPVSRVALMESLAAVGSDRYSVLAAQEVS